MLGRRGTAGFLRLIGRLSSADFKSAWMMRTSARPSSPDGSGFLSFSTQSEKYTTTQNASVTLGTLLKATVLAATLALLGGSPRTRGRGLRQKSHWEGTLDFSS